MKSYRPERAALLWLALMVMLALQSWRMMSTDWLETGFLALLPPAEQQPIIAKAISQLNQERDAKVIWLVGAASTESAIKLANELKQQLDRSGLFKPDETGLLQLQASQQYRQLFAYRYQLLNANTRHLVQTQPDELLQQNLKTLYGPAGQSATANLENDPLLLFNRYFAALNPVKLDIQNGIAIVQEQDKVYAVLPSTLRDAHLRLDKLAALQELSHDLHQQIKAKGGALLATGMPLFTADGADNAQREISTIGLGSSMGILLLMVLAFRSSKPLLLSFTAIASGLLAGWVIAVLVFGKIHIITLVFGASLIGVADDYALHFVCDGVGKTGWQPVKALLAILPGLVFGLLANLLSYAGLILSPFPGLREVALFSASGLLMAWLTVILLFPFCLQRLRPVKSTLIFKLSGLWQQHWPRWLLKHRIKLSVLLLIVLAGGLMKLSPGDDVRELQTPSLQLKNAADSIKRLLPFSRENQFFLVSGKDISDWRQHEQDLLDQLEVARTQGQLNGYQGISAYWPEVATQQQNYRLLAEYLYNEDKVVLYLRNLGFDEKAIAAELKNFADAKSRSISLSGWLAMADKSKQDLWLGCDQHHCSSIVSLSGINNVAELAALGQLPDVTWVDQVGNLNKLFARYRIRASLILAAAFTVVLIGLGLRFGWRNAVTIVAIPVISALLSLSLSGWCNQMFGLFNLFALLLVLGIGTDDAVFFFMAQEGSATVQTGEDQHNKRNTTALAVTLSALTTLLAFGLLAASATEVVHAFGFTVTAGITAAFLLAPLVGYTKNNPLK